MPTFWPWPKKLKPITVATLRTSGCWRRIASAWRTACCVRATVAPGAPL